ncbi:hypothetical protein HPT27_02565 [Permianibacter sp. IMCC34836]|uniref:hypothetical protein n=1 Tax=Permianibacter fluminis TaxID=2738515 RepID=UPI0015579D98|nr:hypothetical protein [Permianibacter fluminis]NQD35888.1 hypothetical protein [Permianibacter fluminis]
MSTYLLFFLFAGAVADEPTSDPQYEAISKVSDKSANCASPDALDKLFQLSSSGLITGVDPQEWLSGVNEDTFLNCPQAFLVALSKQPAATQYHLLNQYFGIQHAPWHLGAELRKWQNDVEVGAFVRAQFAAYLVAEEPQ